MATQEDLLSNQLYISHLDKYLVVDDYSVDEILRASKYFNPDFVWPGWGHSSENHLLPKILKKHGYSFIGPGEHAMRLLGDKISCNRLAEESNVPFIPYTTDISMFASFFKIHAPVLIKCSSLGGGKGISIIENEEQLHHFMETINASTFTESCSSSAFNSATILDRNDEENDRLADNPTIDTEDSQLIGKDTKDCLSNRTEALISNNTKIDTSVHTAPTNIFMSKIIRNARHIEVQALRDNHNNTLVLGTRDCTIQRRYQKVIEEGPALIPAEMIEKMKKCAKKLLTAANYVGVATIEFLVEKNIFYLLEVNTRIQVEHPVTELNTGTNIPELQLDIAMNKDMSYLEDLKCTNHVIAARITAEDCDFNVQTGYVDVSYLPSKNALIYFSVTNGYITEQNDSQFGHVFAWGKSRSDAINHLINVLENIRITGIDTPIPRIIDILCSDFFVENRYHTGTLEQMSYKTYEIESIAYFSSAYFLMTNSTTVNFSYGNDCFHTQVYMVDKDDILVELNSTFFNVKVALCGTDNPRNTVHFYKSFTLNDSPVRLVKLSDEMFRMVSRQSDTFIILSQNICAPCNGRIVEIHDGFVKKDDVLFVIESMKTRIHIRSKDSLRYSKLKNEGTTVSIGDKILNIENSKYRFNTTLKFVSNYTKNDLINWTLNARMLPQCLQTFPEDERIIDFLCRYIKISIEIIKRLNLGVNEIKKIKEKLDTYLAYNITDRDTLVFYFHVKHVYSKILDQCITGASNISRPVVHATNNRDNDLMKEEIHAYLDNINTQEHTFDESFVIKHMKNKKWCLGHNYEDQTIDTTDIQSFTPINFSVELKDKKCCVCPQIMCACGDTKDTLVVVHSKMISDELILFIKLFCKRSLCVYISDETGIKKILPYTKKIVCNSEVYTNIHGYNERIVYDGDTIVEYYFEDLKIDIPHNTVLNVHYNNFLYLMYIYLNARNAKMTYSEIFLSKICESMQKNGKGCSKDKHKDVSNAGTHENMDNQENTVIRVQEEMLVDEKCLNMFRDDIFMLSSVSKIRIGLLAYIFTIDDEKVVFIVNDRSFKNGSFSYKELIFFNLINLFCSKNRMARVHISNNTGARIGIDEQIKNKLIIREKDNHLNLYVQEEKNVHHRECTSDVPSQLEKDTFCLSEIKFISSNDDTGPENLSYSSLTSISTISAFENTFTLSFVTNHSVGIGAYLAVLGKRIIMKRGSVLLLTGYRALNKLNQANLYSSNEELGGVDVMCGNNICQKSVITEYEGIVEIFKWLRFWHEGRKTFLLCKNEMDVCANVPELKNYVEMNCREVSELISHGIVEYSSLSSSNIRTVRCYIKNMPVGIIYACENGTNVLDAYSSEKFSDFVEQINRENINLVILANFKGFSGHNVDMKLGILKYGSRIIENLKMFQQKIFVYVGSGWQVRGGTFVILDKFINKNIRVYASKNSRIGILQPDGLSEVKFKENERIKLLLNNKLEANDKNLNELAIKFCELHDHPERLVLKNRIDGLLEIDELKESIYRYFIS